MRLISYLTAAALAIGGCAGTHSTVNEQITRSRGASIAERNLDIGQDKFYDVYTYFQENKDEMPSVDHVYQAMTSLDVVLSQLAFLPKGYLMDGESYWMINVVAGLYSGDLYIEEIHDGGLIPHLAENASYERTINDLTRASIRADTDGNKIISDMEARQFYLETLDNVRK